MEPEESPILFSVPMIPPIQLDIKTQTRRSLKLPPWIEDVDRAVFKLNEQAKDGKTPGLALYEDGRPQRRFVCPYGGAGRRLWVRESCRALELPTGHSGVWYPADGAFRLIEDSSEAADRWMELNAYRGRRGAQVPAIHMPRWVSRLSLLNQAVCIERVQSITDVDAEEEGVVHWAKSDAGAELLRALGFAVPDRPRFLFELLWRRINGPESWDANPWVWVVTFKRLEVPRG